MNFKAIFFDLDGTLLNTITDLHAACNYALKKHNYKEVTLEEVRLAVGNGIRKLIERVVPANLSKEEVDVVFNDFTIYYKAHVDVLTYPYPNIIKLLEETKKLGIINVIISNKFIEGVDALYNKFFRGLVDLALGPSDVFKPKPDLSMVNFAIEKYNLKKEEILYVGDSGVDIKIGRAHV